MILNPSKGTPWVAYINENCFDTYGCAPPEKLSKFIIKRNGLFFSEDKMQGLTNEREPLYASYCFQIFYLTKFVGLDFKSAVLILYYRNIGKR